MISFVIVTYNSGKHITACLNHVSSITDIPYEIIVVDNNSKDNSRQIIRKGFRSVRLFQMGQNLGFARAVNIGVRNAKQDVVFLLNPDAQIKTSELMHSIHYLFLDHIGVLGPQVVNPQDSRRQFSARRFPTLRTGFFNSSSFLTRLFPNNSFSREYLDPIIDKDKPQEVDWVSGCAMMFRKDIFNSIGGFDEQFFVFHEDVDFCYRLKRAGYKVVYYPDVIVAHEIGISRTIPTIRINYERHRGMWLYYRKHLQRVHFIGFFVAFGIILRFTVMSIKILLSRLYENTTFN